VVLLALLSCPAVVSAAGSPGSRRRAPDIAGRAARSPNWSGYAQTASGPYTSVSASWTAPSVDCARTPDAAVSFWVGLDGYTDATVEQTGTEATCSNGRATYGGWWEMFPKPGVNFARRTDPVLPGDVISASVMVFGENRFRLTLADATQGWSRSVTRKSKAAKLSSAEVITEAPSGGGGILPLADFGVVDFNSITVDGNRLTGSSAGVESVTMAAKKEIEAQPSALLESAFSDSWQAE
jgi:hypothetical protein